MFHKILVAIDQSEMGERVFARALELAQATQAHLMLLHVLSDAEVGYPDASKLDEHLEQWEQCKQQGFELLQTRQTIATKAGIASEYTQPSGAAPATICRIAKNWNADLIVIGQRELSGLQRLIQGSVSNYVLHRAHCSVLTVH